MDIIVHDSRVTQIEKTSACGRKNHRLNKVNENKK
ncbi:MAG TPA: DUF2292 domain-containing protein [Verrucomicrobiae bacterium]|nr:DUF2292 domain-containing protein [Verrucomicrobiae bacterium]